MDLVSSIWMTRPFISPNGNMAMANSIWQRMILLYSLSISINEVISSLLLFFWHAKFYYAKSGYILPILLGWTHNFVLVSDVVVGVVIFVIVIVIADSRARIVAIIVDNLFVCWIFIQWNCRSCFIKMSIVIQ